MISLERIRCTNCGGEFDDYDPKATVMRCSREGCRALFIIPQATAFAKMQMDRDQDIQKLRGLMGRELQNRNTDEMLRWSAEIQRWIPNDFYALFVKNLAYKLRGKHQDYHRFLQESHAGTITEESRDWAFAIILENFKIQDKEPIRRYIHLHYTELLKKQKEAMLTEALQALRVRDDLFADVPRDVFICHSSSDSDIALEVYERLEADGNTCWISLRNLPPDTIYYWDKIKSAIRRCRIILVISSEQCMYREDPKTEMIYADECNLKRLEYKIDDSQHTIFFKHYFDGIQWVRGGYHNKAALHQLCERVYMLIYPGKARETATAVYVPISIPMSSAIGSAMADEAEPAADVIEPMEPAVKPVMHVTVESATPDVLKPLTQVETENATEPETHAAAGPATPDVLESMTQVETEHVTEPETLTAAVPTVPDVTKLEAQVEVVQKEMPARHVFTESDASDGKEPSSPYMAFKSEKLFFSNDERIFKDRGDQGEDLPSKKMAASVNTPRKDGKKPQRRIITLYIVLSLLAILLVTYFVFHTGFTFSGDSTLTLTGYSGWEKEVVIPAEVNGKIVTDIGNNAFNKNYYITSISIPDSIKSIGSYAFYGCSGLTNVTIPDSVTNIGFYAFGDCSNLTNVTIPDSITSIGDDAFHDCSSLTNVTIPDSVTSIGNNTFDDCSSLTNVTIPDSVTNIGAWAFDNCSNLTNVTIPDSVTSIRYNAFSYCTNLASITIPKSVTSIGEKTFEGCEKLTISGFHGSTAETYAVKNNIPFKAIQGEASPPTPSPTATTYPTPNTEITNETLYQEAYALYQAGKYIDSLPALQKSADGGYASAQNLLGVYNELGYGVKQNLEEAVKWYRLAADQGLARAQLNLGACYLKGNGIEQDHTEAFNWFKLAADQGHAEGQGSLGLCYYSGIGTEQNYTEAYKWLKLGADQGYSNAQYALGDFYYNGIGIEQNYAEAVKWFSLAAEQGQAIAQYDLGLCFYHGNGVALDINKAKDWFMKAASQGFSKASDILKKIELETSTSLPTTTPVTANLIPIAIGAISPNTGDLAAYGEAVSNGIDLAVAEINAAGGVLGRPLEVTHMDDKFDATEAANAFNKLVSDGVCAIIGSVSSGITTGLASLADAEGMLLLTPTATADTVTEGLTGVFRACYKDSFQGEVAAKLAVDLGVKKVAVLYASGDTYSSGLYKSFKAACETLGLELVAAESSSSISDTDYTTQLTNIVNSGAELIFAPYYYNSIGPYIVPQARAAGFTGYFAGADGWDGTLGTMVDDKILYNKCFWVNHYAPDDPSEIMQNFVKGYTDTYSAESLNALTALAYDSVYMLKQAIETAGTEETAKVIEAMTGMSFSGVTGSFTLDETGTPAKAAPIIEYVDGTAKFYKYI